MAGQALLLEHSSRVPHNWGSSAPSLGTPPVSVGSSSSLSKCWPWYSSPLGLLFALLFLVHTHSLAHPPQGLTHLLYACNSQIPISSQALLLRSPRDLQPNTLKMDLVSFQAVLSCPRRLPCLCSLLSVPSPSILSPPPLLTFWAPLHWLYQPLHWSPSCSFLP